MIAKLIGIVDSKGDGSAVVNVNGVGYLVFCSGKTLFLLTVGETVSLLIETHVREDAIHLYGFIDKADQHWFRMLTTVQGVGAKAALAILSTLTAEELVRAIAMGDRASVVRAPGVGAKLAARVVSELKDKAQFSVVDPSLDASTSVAQYSDGALGDAVSALVNLGFKPLAARAVVSRVAARLGTDCTVEALIRGGLSELTPGGDAA